MTLALQRDVGTFAVAADLIDFAEALLDDLALVLAVLEDSGYGELGDQWMRGRLGIERGGRRWAGAPAKTDTPALVSAASVTGSQRDTEPRRGVVAGPGSTWITPRSRW